MSFTNLITGLGGAIGCDLRRAQNQLLFVEYNGKLSRLNLFRTGTIVSSGSGVLHGTWLFDFDAGVEVASGAAADVWWEQKTAVLRDMVGQNGATLVNLGHVDFGSLTPDTLSSLTYSTAPIDGNNDATNKLTTNDVFAVHTTSGNYAKVKVVSYGYDLQIQWVTYQLDSPYQVLGTGYTNPEDVKASADGAHAYVTERSGDLVKVALANANRPMATVICSGMTAPQQMFLDETHGTAYIVEYAAAGNLWRVDLTSGAKDAVLSNLDHAVGVVLSSDLQSAYISEQTTGPDGGRVSRFELSSGTRHGLVTGLTAPFFLTWLDAAETSLFVAERDPANRVTLIDVASATSHVVASGLPSRPSSVATLTAGQILVCSDQSIEEVDQVHDVPFAGTLPLMVNHFRAYNDGARFYRVKVDGVVHTDPWTDEKWNGVQYVAVTSSTVTVGGASGYYRVRPINELFLWMNPSLGDLLSTLGLSNGLHTIVLEFVNAGGTLLETSTPLTIRVDNNYCTATVGTPEVHGTTADPDCGLLHYITKNTDLVSMPFSVGHPNGFATFSFTLIKGVNAVALPAAPPTSGPVSTAVSPITASIVDLMGKCDIAGFGEWVYVAASATNGWWRQSQYDASAAIAFVLAP